MSFFSFVKNNKEKYSLVFNIGSGSLSGGIIKFTEEPGENIVYYAKEIIPFQQDISVPRHLELMKSALEKLAHKIQAEGLKKINTGKNKNVRISQVFYTFSSPWSISQTKVIRLNESKPFRVNKNYLDKLIDKQEEQFQVDIAKTGKIIEKKIIQLKANGYIINEICANSVKNLEISVFFTAVPDEILKTVENAVMQSFHTDNIYCHSQTLSLFSNIRNLFPQAEDFVQVNVSEEITDISIIKDGTIINSASIPFGRNQFIREISQSLKVTDEIADSIIKMYQLKNTDELATFKNAVAIDKAVSVWSAKLSEVLSLVKEKTYISELFFLIADDDLITFLKDKLQRDGMSVSLLKNKKLKPALKENDLIFKLELMFLDNLYKI